MPIRSCKLSIIALAASLQYFAPLMHGHANVQAHELEGIHHVHLPGDVVEILPTIPGEPAQLEQAAASHGQAPADGMGKEHKLEGFAALLVQAVLLISALVLLMVAIGRGFFPSEHRRPKPESPRREHPPTAAPPTSPL